MGILKLKWDNRAIIIIPAPSYLNIHKFVNLYSTISSLQWDQPDIHKRIYINLPISSEDTQALVYET